MSSKDPETGENRHSLIEVWWIMVGMRVCGALCTALMLSKMDLKEESRKAKAILRNDFEEGEGEGGDHREEEEGTGGSGSINQPLLRAGKVGYRYGSTIV
jgi:hypothetical protein